MLISLFGSTHRQRLRIIGVMLVVLTTVFVLFRSDGGIFHGNQRAVVLAQKATGFVLVGTFGKPKWPALVVDRDRGVDELDFVTTDGQAHRYRGFSGAMRALHFRSLSGSSFTLVFLQHSGKRDPLAP